MMEENLLKSFRVLYLCHEYMRKSEDQYLSVMIMLKFPNWRNFFISMGLFVSKVEIRDTEALDAFSSIVSKNDINIIVLILGIIHERVRVF